MKKVLKNINWLRVAGLLVMLVIGLLLIIFADEFLHIVCYIMGVTAIVLFLVRLVTMLFSGKRDVYDISIGFILAIVGVLLLFTPSIALSWFVALVFGLILIVDGVSKLQDVAAFYRMEIKNWWADLVVAILCIILGSLVIVNPFATQKLLMVVIGAAMVFDAVFSIASSIYTAVNVSKTDKEDDGGTIGFTDI